MLSDPEYQKQKQKRKCNTDEAYAKIQTSEEGIWVNT